MNDDNRTAAFRLHGMLKLEKVGDYLKLVNKKIRIVLKVDDPKLKSRKIFHADVVDLSESGTHLVLRELRVKKFIFFSKDFEKHAVPLKNIATVRVLDKYGETG